MAIITQICIKNMWFDLITKVLYDHSHLKCHGSQTCIARQRNTNWLKCFSLQIFLARRNYSYHTALCQLQCTRDTHFPLSKFILGSFTAERLLLREILSPACNAKSHTRWHYRQVKGQPK